MIRRIFKKVFSTKKRLPRTVVLKRFLPRGCRFEIVYPVEEVRVERYGDEEEFTEKVLAEISPLDVLYDIGSCVGMITVHAALKGATVVAFEPDPSYRIRLKKNLDLNDLSNVQIVEWAVSDSCGQVTLYTDGVEGNSPNLRSAGTRGSVQVATDSIDNALLRREIPYPTVVKMDIEGAEASALRGMQELMLSDLAPRIIFLETHPEFLKLFGSSEEDVLELLKSYGYSAFYQNERAAQRHFAFRKA